MAAFIDLNADLGEGDRHDAELLTIVSSCNIACGGHAGDATSMQLTVKLAIHNGVAIGAHPSYPDRDGFGRRSRFLTGSSLRPALLEQINSLRVIAEAQDAVVTHVKPHGALYIDAATDSDLASVVASAVAATVPGAALVGFPESELENAARSHHLRFIAEAFIDRAYKNDGRLVSRSEADAVHSDIRQIVAQAISLATEKKVTSRNGELIAAPADTLCIHGDTPGAAIAAREVRGALEKQGVEIRAICRR